MWKYQGELQIYWRLALFYKAEEIESLIVAKE